MSPFIRCLVQPLILVCAGCATSEGVFQRDLTQADFAKIVPGKTTASEVTAILGPPERKGQLRTEMRETWRYPYGGGHSFWVEFDPGGTVALTNVTVDFNSGKYGGP